MLFQAEDKMDVGDHLKSLLISTWRVKDAFLPTLNMASKRKMCLHRGTPASLAGSTSTTQMKWST